MFEWLRKLFTEEPIPSIAPKVNRAAALRKALIRSNGNPKEPQYPIQAYVAPRGVVPAGATSGIAQDSNFSEFCTSLGPMQYGPYAGFAGFPGYQYLAILQTRAEYRAMASALATELTREWIQIVSTDTEDESTKAKITEVTKFLEDLKLQQIIQRAAEHDAYFGRAQIFVSIAGHSANTPLIVSDKSISKGSKMKLSVVEAMWTTPNTYNALDPTADDFYRPPSWWMLGKEVHASRLLTIITRPLPDILKPGFNFGGISLSQLAEPYVNNWLRTRQSVSDIISNYSITALATAMGQVLESGEDDGSSLIARAELFVANRDNQGVFLLNKDTEELIQVNTPLSELSSLQAQAQEHMCAVSREPAIILTGIEPVGLNASSEGSMRAWYDWVAAQQEAFWRLPIQIIFEIAQIILYGSVDEKLSFNFVPLFQLTGKELSEIRTADAATATAYVSMGAVDNIEVRERLARDPESGFEGLDLGKTIENPMMQEDEGDDDSED